MSIRNKWLFNIIPLGIKYFYFFVRCLNGIRIPPCITLILKYVLGSCGTSHCNYLVNFHWLPSTSYLVVIIYAMICYPMSLSLWALMRHVMSQRVEVGAGAVVWPRGQVSWTLRRTGPLSEQWDSSDVVSTYSINANKNCLSFHADIGIC
jgi:hypothetical protein